MSWVLWWFVATSLMPDPPAAVWVWPTAGEHLVLHDFEAPLTPWGPGHRGLDLAASQEDIVAPVSGTISFSGWIVERGVLTIRTDEGWLVSMEPVTTEMSAGSTVHAGEPIGTLEHGHCEELCLHIGLRRDDRYQSPARELGLLKRAVLLPW